MDGAKAVADLNAEGVLKFTAGGQEIELAKEDLLIETSSDDNLVAESDGGVTVVLDTVLTDELIEEGFVLELTSKIQTMRKEAGFEVMDRIAVYAEGNARIEKILNDHSEEIAKVVLADRIETGKTGGYKKSWKINSEEVTLGVEKQS